MSGFVKLSDEELAAMVRKLSEADATIRAQATEIRRLREALRTGSLFCETPTTEGVGCLECGHPLTEADKRAEVCPYCGVA